MPVSSCQCAKSNVGDGPDYAMLFTDVRAGTVASAEPSFVEVSSRVHVPFPDCRTVDVMATMLAMRMGVVLTSHACPRSQRTDQ